ncbi:MAG TPA: type II secretion system F family protein [Kineosporiaceae bacterium]|nr:type II secretion system F family protein [Kineosporiaceae bacterium]
MSGLMSPVGALIGLAAGVGACMVWLRLPRHRRPGLDERLAPYLRDAAPVSRLLAAPSPRSPLTTLERVLAPVMADAVRWVDRFSGGHGSVRRRLDRLGSGRRVEQFRAEQVVWGALGAVAGAVMGLLGVLSRSGVSVVSVVGLLLVGALLGVLGRDQLLTTQARRREQRMLTEFPTIAELFALSVGAGEGVVGALERMARSCHGELSAELRRTLAEVRAGASLIQALERLASRTGLPALARFVDGVAVAIERGTPLADVLRAQAQDVRELSRRRLIESGGRKEIAMMVPVVFLVLPVTVLFAVFPGLAVLELHV